MSDPIVNAMTQAIEGQDLWHGRYATPAGPATARAILAHLSDLGWVLAPTPPDALQECYKGCSICATLNEMDEAGE